MDSARGLIVVLLSVLLFIGCQQDFTIECAALMNNNLGESDNYICLNDVINYLEATENTRSDRDNYSIDPFCGTKGDTLMYIVNYGHGDGWQIFSSDARTPAIIAESANGYFSLEEGSPSLRVWMNCIADDLYAVRNASNDQLNFSADEIRANQIFWNKNTTRETREESDPTGHWESELVSSEEIIYDTLLHMTPHWDQWSPYNAYCPLKSIDSTKRVPAGCVAIASSGVLYYLHELFGVPETMVSEGYCYGDVNNYSRYFGSPTTTAWSNMNFEYSNSSANAEALMIGHVGNIVNMHYTAGYSWALPANIRTGLFSYYGITCSHGNYDSAIIKSNLENYLPVIVTASDLVIPLDGDIHCFVIDGFKRTYIRRTYYNYWVIDYYDPQQEYDEPEPYYSYTNTSPQITKIKINWGWWSQWSTPPVNDGWYSLTAGWAVIDNGNTYNYNHNINIIYNIAVNE